MLYGVKGFIPVFLLLFHSIFAIEYCKLCKKGTHTLCRYKEGPSDRCIEYKKPEFSSSVKKYIVDIHNDIRNHIASGQETRGALGRQPAASNMNSLQWDNELAETAQRWADQCLSLHEEFQHDQCRATGRFEVGQNVLTAVTSTIDVPEIAILILNWYKQVEDVLPSDVETFSGIQRGKFLIGQYTQLVWAETRFVGCGMSTFRNRNTTDPKAMYLHRLVCNYGPRGNLIGSSVYNRGIPCSRCTYGKCDPVRTSLCRSFEEPLRKYDVGRTATKEESVFHVEMPISLFNTLSLAYILKNNLTDVINNILQKVNVHLGSHETKQDQHKSEINESLNLNHMLAVLASIMTQFNLSEAENDFRKTAGKIYLEPLDHDFLRNALRRTSNMLYKYENFHKIINRQIYDLKNGKVIIDDCKHSLHQCQYEDDEFSTKIPPEGDIVLPNNMIYRKIKGIWFHGKCRCDYVYRSSTSSAKYSKLIVYQFIFHVLKYIIK